MWTLAVIVFLTWFEIVVVIAHTIVAHALCCFERELGCDGVLAGGHYCVELLDGNCQGIRWRIECDHEADREVRPVVNHRWIGSWLDDAQDRELKVFGHLRESEVDLHVYFDFDGDRCDHVLLVLFDDPDQNLLVNGHRYCACESEVECQRGAELDAPLSVIAS
jgi:hypothetical protein